MPLKIDRAAYERLPAAAKREVDAALASYAQKAQQNPMVGYMPSAPQAKLLAAHDHIVMARAGNRFGKTSGGVIKNLVDSLDEADIPDHLLKYKKWEPPFHLWVLAPTLDDSIENVILPEVKKWCPDYVLEGGSWDKAYSIGRRTLRFRNGSKWKFFAYKQDSEQLTGAAVHRIWYDEPPPQKHRNEAMMRLATNNGDELFTMTPLHGASWLEKEIWKKRNEPGITVITGSGLDNPIMHKDALERIIAQYPEEEREARLHGEFVYFSGRIFKEFNHRDHVIPTIAPRDLDGHEVVVGIDPGWDHGFAVTFNAFDPLGNCLTFDEIHARGRTVRDVAQEIFQRLRYWGVTPAYYVIDSASEQTSVITGSSIRSEFRRYGIIAQKAKNKPNSWYPSVNYVKTLLSHKDEFGNPAPRYRVTENCNFTIDGFVSYHYKDNADDASIPDKKPQPYKKEDDEVDTVRYVLMSRYYSDPLFDPVELEEPEPDLLNVAAPQFHLEQLAARAEDRWVGY